MQRVILIQQLIKLTSMQSDALKEEDVETFISLLEDREAILAEIKVLGEKEPHEKNLAEEKLIADLIALDNENRIEFERQHNEVKNKLKEVRMMRQRENNYSNPYNVAREEGILFDKRNR